MSDPDRSGPAAPRRSWLDRLLGRGAQHEVHDDLPAPAFVIEESVPASVRLAAAYAWRLLIIVAALAAALFLVAQLKLIVVPLLIAVLISALLIPLRNLLVRHRWPTAVAVIVCMLVLVGVVGGLVLIVVTQIRSEASSISSRSVEAFQQFTGWLKTGPLDLSQTQIDDTVKSITSSLQGQTDTILSGALTVGSTLGDIGAGLLLVLFSTIFIVLDGTNIWRWIVRVFPRRARPAVDGAGKAGWVTLGRFVRVQIFVAAVDATGIGLVAFFLGLPLVVPIAVLVFLGSFVPLLGAIATGVLAVIVALIYAGPLQALIMLGGVLLVQQVEGHILQPLVMGTAVKVHPLAVVLSVTGGSLLAGIPGALFAVPLVATLNVMVLYVARGTWREGDSRTFVGPQSQVWRTVSRRVGPGTGASEAEG